MNKKKTIAVAIVLALILLIGGMLAFYTDTASKDNVFTLGNNIDIELTEQWAEVDGQNILPGAVVQKAPSITNKANSSEAYVFAKVIVPTYTKDGDPTTKHEMFTFTANAGWIPLSERTEAGDTYEYVYAYGADSTLTKLIPGATTKSAVFSNVELDKTIKSKDTFPTGEDLKIRVEAYGIQTANLTNAQGAAVSAPADVYALFGNN